MNRGFQEQAIPQPPKGNRLSWLGLLAALLILSAAGGEASAQSWRLSAAESAPEWDKLNSSVIEQLVVEDLGAVIASLPPSPPRGDVHASMRRLNLFARAGNRMKVSEVIDSLPVITGPLAQSLLSGAVDFLVYRQEFDLARRMVEKLPQARPLTGHQVVGQWAEKGDPVEIDRWLAARMAQNYDYWLFIRLEFRSRRGTAGELVDSLENEVKAHPADLARAIRYLKAARYAGKAIRFDWMGETCKPALAAECFVLAFDLADSNAAVSLFERAISLSFTDRDSLLLSEEMNGRLSLFLPITERKEFVSLTKFQLAKIYQTSDQAEKAQKIMEELAAAYPDGLPSFDLSQFAGKVQAISGARVIENRFKQAEVKNTNSAQYWYDRAQYYKGRKERAEAIDAYEKALKLSPLTLHKFGQYDEYGNWRRIVFLDYIDFLDTPVSSPEARRLLQSEFESVRLETAYAGFLVSAMRRHWAWFSSAETDRLWDFLASQTTWYHLHRDLLGWMIKSPAGAERNLLWSRAEKLTASGDPSRSMMLGWAMILNKDSERAVPLLKDAIRRWGADREKYTAVSLLYQIYIDTDNWKDAEALCLAERHERGVGIDEIRKWALAAARAGAYDEAIRLWRLRANIDRGDFNGLSELARLGLKDRLRSFYQQLAQDEPASWAPRAALQSLD
jgi:tetratricopeptide (TPR) repeat protein